LDIVAIRHARAKFGFLLLAEEDDVQMDVIVGKIGDGFASCLGSIGGRVLTEVVDARLAGRNVAAQKIVKLGRRGDAGEMNGFHLIRQIRIGLRRRSQSEYKNQRGGLHWYVTPRFPRASPEVR
jgi:hypothetical protein